MVPPADVRQAISITRWMTEARNAVTAEADHLMALIDSLTVEDAEADGEEEQQQGDAQVAAQ